MRDSTAKNKKMKLSSGTIGRNAAFFLSVLIVTVSGSFMAITSAQPGKTEKNALYYNKAGWEHLDKNDTIKSILNFKQALRSNPDYKEAVIGLGMSYLRTGAFDESLKLFERALRLDKNNPQALTGMGFAMTGSGRYNDALSTFEKAIESGSENIDAYYGIASLYHGMGKELWAKRKLETIMRLNPFHYDSLLLLAEIKGYEKRYEEALQLVEKAINSDPENPEGYVRYGKIRLMRYMITGDEDYLSDAEGEFNNALTKQNTYYSAGIYLGYVSFIKGDMAGAMEHFKNAHSIVPDNPVPRYNLAVAGEKLNDLELSYKFFSSLNKSFPYDEILEGRFEDFLIENEFKSGNPSRIALSNKHFEQAAGRIKTHLSDQAILHLRRSVLLNPLRKDAREILRDYYMAQDYYRFYIDEIKDLMRIYPDGGYQETLTIAVFKRRERLYHRTGFSPDIPERNVPSVLVLDFIPRDAFNLHFDAGTVIANQLTFTLQQFGRMSLHSIRQRKQIAGMVLLDDIYLEKSFEKITELTGNDVIPDVDYIVYGSYLEGKDHLSINFKIMNFKTGVVIGDYEISESGHGNLQRLVLRAARRVYEHIPYEGRVLKIDDTEGVIVNLGLLDGFKKDDLIVIYKNKDFNRSKKLYIRSKLLLKVKEADTLVLSAIPVNDAEINLIELNDTVYPLNKRRAKKLK